MSTPKISIALDGMGFYRATIVWEVGVHSETPRYSNADRTNVLLNAQNVIRQRRSSRERSGMDWPYGGGIE